MEINDSTKLQQVNEYQISTTVPSSIKKHFGLNKDKKFIWKIDDKENRIIVYVENDS